MRFQNIILDLLRVLPKNIIQYLAGQPIVIDGNILDPNIQIIAKLNSQQIQKELLEPEDYRKAAKKLDEIALKNISGVIIGFISVPLGIGGGSLMVPFMRTFGYDIRKSIGTAAAVGFLIAVTGTVTMITGGKIINNVNAPFSVGYINLLGFMVFVPVTMVMARLGAKAVYKIDKKLLSKIFGTFLIVVSIRSFFEYLSIN